MPKKDVLIKEEIDDCKLKMGSLFDTILKLV
jgi:hypothetical protein